MTIIIIQYYYKLLLNFWQHIISIYSASRKYIIINLPNRRRQDNRQASYLLTDLPRGHFLYTYIYRL